MIGPLLRESLQDQLGEFLARQSELSTERAQSIADACVEIFEANVNLEDEPEHETQSPPDPRHWGYADMAYHMDLA